MSLPYLRTTIVSLAALVVLAGCSPPFPRDLLDSVAKDVAYADLHREPERFRGKIVMVGGSIVETRNLKEGTRIEVVQRPLDGEGRPHLTDETGGRFLVFAAEFHDAAVYQRGRAVTVIAEVTGRQVQPLGEAEYAYPVLQARAVHLWDPYAGPRFSIGIGIGVFHSR